MDNFSSIQLADNSCTRLFKKIIGVASYDNFFQGRDSEEILASAVTTGQKNFIKLYKVKPRRKRDSIGFRSHIF